MGFRDLAIDALDFSESPLRFLWLEITQHCNLRCVHCYTSSSPARKHNDIDWLPVIEEAYALGCRQIQFIGGEPLSHPSILQYIRSARKLGFQFIEVYTNAALLSDSTCDVFAENSVHVATSFYSATAAAHEAVTLTAGSFEQTVAGIKRVVASAIPLRVGLILTGNDANEADMVKYLVALGVDRSAIKADNVRPVGRGSKMTPFESRAKTLCGACWNGKLTVSYDGACYPCVFSRDVNVGNIRHQSLTEIVTGHPLKAFRLDYGAEVLASRALAAADDDDDANCTPQCNPASTCGPNCLPGDPAPCNPWNCSPGPDPHPDCPPGTCAPCSPACRPECAPNNK
ncbi:MAG TPA: radical SAM protein [Candidatus Angelobacter sp.]|jgi:MoaA/NifB/PqqE/SkfB family radical SAM enzyme|nr:radical SAM protein [Candidatus Angelobacter sp.]